MSVVARTFASIPARSGSDTWKQIIGVLAPDSSSDAYKELLSVSGIASSIISRETLANSPLVVYGGPGARVRIYCVHGESAIAGDGLNETLLATTPTQGDWKISIPCDPDDLAWMSDDLKTKSSRITVRNMNDLVETDSSKAESIETNAINVEAFLRK